MTAPLRVDLACCSLTGPGLDGWEEALPVLRGEQPFQLVELARPSVKHLPASDRRRYTFAIALAVTTAMKAIRLDGRERIPAVFACSGGDTDVINRLCSALTQPGCPVSPQQFVNSVHNAPAGYWSIAERNSAAATSLSAYDATFAAGLLEAAVQIHAGGGKALLIAYDVPAPMPIWPFRPLSAPFAAAMLLTAPGLEGPGLARLELQVARDRDETRETRLEAPELEALRLGNPAARSLPLLEAVAQGRTADLVLPYLAPLHLGVHVGPCC